MNNFRSQICTSKEQSKRLLELGLKPETADMSYYILDDDSVLTIGMAQVYREITKGGKIVKKQNAEIIPAWSLHRLLLLCGVSSMITRDALETAYDVQINAIENLIKNDYFNKEYLNY